MKRKLTLGFSPYGHGVSIDPFSAIFENAQNIVADGIKGVDAVILWGGEDWHPQYYNQTNHPLNGNRGRDTPSKRDVFEWRLMLFCKHHKIPMIGVCRGAQGLCIAAGGKLVQHVNNHGFNHYLTTVDGKEIMANSTHHQMMYPYDVPHEMVAWTSPPRSLVYEDDKGSMKGEMSGRKEPEIVYFPTINSLAIQGHPEYEDAPAEFVDYCVNAVRHYLDIDSHPNSKGFSQ